MDRKLKLNVLRQLAMTMGDQTMVPILSFLAGRLDQIHFVRNLEGADVAVTLSPGARLWPRVPFRSDIDGASVNHPLAFIERMAMRDDDILIRVEFGALETPQWYLEVLTDDVEDPRHQLEESIDQLRNQIDLALDAYRTASDAIDGADDDERKYLRFVLDKAKSEMRSLNAQLSELEMKLGWSE